VGDWVVGLGSKNSPIDDISGHVVYAMRVSKVLTMHEYDTFCCKELPGKIPNWSGNEFQGRVGDCIYDYAGGRKPKLRVSVHTKRNRKTDLGGKNVLLSDRFFYFGNKPIRLPEHLEPIVHQTQGHKSRANQPYLQEFVSWIEGLRKPVNTIFGDPQKKDLILSLSAEECEGICAKQHEEDDLQDREIC